MFPADPMVNFVIDPGKLGAGAAKEEELDRLRQLPWDCGIRECTTQGWTWPAYAALRKLRSTVRLSAALDEDAINVVHAGVLRRAYAFDPRRHFIITVRADFLPFPFAHHEIVQNKSAASARAFYLPHFPQPGLIGRSPQRDSVVNICFSGRLQNMQIDSGRFALDLGRLGLRFCTRELGQWHDLRDMDVLLGVRSLDKSRYNHKPPTKMFNAWHAGIPFIGGYDSAYEQCGKPGVDHLRVSSYPELLEALSLLKNNRQLYESLVREGFLAARSYTVESIANRWLDFLYNVAQPRFDNWKRHPGCSAMGGQIRRIGYWLFDCSPLSAFSRIGFKLSR